MKNLIKWIAIGFGTGLSPVMPGTVGTLVGLPIAWWVMRLPEIGTQVIICAVLSLLSIPICEVAEKVIGGKDPGCIVADEYLTLPITVIGLTDPWALLSGFVLHRIFDITKPPPIKQLQHIHGGFGITIDDFLAALIALGLNHAIFYYFG
ncbi:phosphatidylglycerophosphatase A family protein [Pontiella agarivorans]|uniref:Phosphatidylglycerophosphatase A n=1 Tax=Pontiella agarivorans TaxID=3038953 RepID=A0ABU5MSQ6_9BACT|nr:phosphatidylglycerophosphatase A [Pontiella agarivorans]MDZ8117168.1 phosphatidylglycerophosphatase A [Pontiella agarivorans]